MLLDDLLRRVVKLGSLTLIDPKGRSYHYGEPANDSTVVVRLNGALTPWRIVLNPKLAVGEAFMDGRLVLERGSIYDFLETVVRNLGPHGELPFQAAPRVWEQLIRRSEERRVGTAVVRTCRERWIGSTQKKKTKQN